MKTINVINIKILWIWNKIKYDIYMYLKSILFKILVFIYLFIRLLIIIGEYIFILKTILF